MTTVRSWICVFIAFSTLAAASLVYFLGPYFNRSQIKVHQNNGNMKIMIDTDAGSDDAMAIFYLLRAEKYSLQNNDTNGPKIVGITCVNGNTKVDNVVINVLRVLEAAGRLDIPVYKGASKSIMITPENENYFGVDGLGDVNWPTPPRLDLLKQEHAVNALVRMVNENPGEITILALGPLTNIALAIRIYENFLLNVNKIMILGGAVEGIGNISPGVEFNFFMDPEANYITLNGTTFANNTVILMPWEACHKLGVSKKWRKEVLGALKSDEIIFMNKVEHIDQYDESDWFYADVMLATVVLNETLITRMESHGVEAITQGVTRGGLIVDSTNLRNNIKKVDLIYSIDKEGYQNTLLYYLK